MVSYQLKLGDEARMKGKIDIISSTGMNPYDFGSFKKENTVVFISRLFYDKDMLYRKIRESEIACTYEVIDNTDLFFDGEDSFISCS